MVYSICMHVRLFFHVYIFPSSIYNGSECSGEEEPKPTSSLMQGVLQSQTRNEMFRKASWAWGKSAPIHIQSPVTHAGFIESEHVDHELIFNSTHLENSEVGHVYRAPKG